MFVVKTIHNVSKCLPKQIHAINTINTINTICNARTRYHTWTYEEAVTKDTPQFIVTRNNGFLPRADPLSKLPSEFAKLEDILQRMPLTKKDGEPGLLAKGNFGDTVRRELPLYDVSEITDSALLMALFRDYTFAASAYLLEPCDLLHKKSGDFGQGRDHLPANIAVPLLQISDKIKAKPFMEYAQSYALYNYARKDALKPVCYENIELIRQFSGLPSESGFILVHVDMVSHSKDLVTHTIAALDAVNERNRYEFDDSIAKCVSTMQTINKSMETMWNRSLPSDYLKFRTFILGTKNQEKVFPKGVRYEGVGDSAPRYYRGESGANDSIIPTMDNLLQLTEKMPKNEMTSILKDFRSYRPENHSQWLTWVEKSAQELGVEKFAEGTARSLSLYMMLLNEVRDFRSRHWNFAKEYIIKRTAYPKATGGSPMATWLPNQLSVVLRTLREKYAIYEKMPDRNGDLNFHKTFMVQTLRLESEIKKMTSMYGQYASKENKGKKEEGGTKRRSTNKTK